MSDENSALELREPPTVDVKIVEFWQDQGEWPFDTRTHIFLARAVDLLGTANFRDDWVALRDPEHPLAYNQRGAVFEELRDALESNDLTTFIRAFGGGPFEQLDGSVWNTDYYRKRFRYCSINKEAPFDDEGDPEAESFLYLKKSELDSFIGARATKDLRLDDVDKLPKFLAALVRTAAELNLTAESPALPSSVYETKFREVAGRLGIEVGLSNRLVEYAGTILRPPGAGRAASKK